MGTRLVLEHTPFGFAHMPLVHVHVALMHTAFRELSQGHHVLQVPPVSVEHVALLDSNGPDCNPLLLMV